MPRPSLLIESWLPIAEIGAESMRERGASSALPPLYFLHVWWARRPLIASRAAILAGVLPQWSDNWPEALRAKFPDENSYHQWFLRLCGIYGDPVKARKLIDLEKKNGIHSPGNKYGYARAFTNLPSRDELSTMSQLVEVVWGKKPISVLDPFSGGGSIPFEALQLGFTTFANDLNPVAALILKATLDYPVRFGEGFSETIYKWGKRWSDLAQSKLKPYYSAPDGEPSRTIYMWARTVACPSTGKPIPLAPNWWVSSSDPLVAVRLITEPSMNEPRFEVVKNAQARESNPDEGTIGRGVARSPWTGETIDGEYIKAEAKAGRMGQVLYCVEVDAGNGKEYRAPSEFDYEMVRLSEKIVRDQKEIWIAKGYIPDELFPNGNDNRPIIYGMPNWSDFFSPRQLLTKAVFMETLLDLATEIRTNEGVEKGIAIQTYLAFAFDKCLNYNSRLSSWITSRKAIRSVFDRHDFAFAWSFIEFNGAGGFLTWTVNQITDAYKEISKLVAPLQKSISSTVQANRIENLTISNSSASAMKGITSKSIQNITVDPPYYDNVQYAELSDFFYVWLKLSVGSLYPDFFQDELTNKDDEAVANPARFANLVGNKNDLAKSDYERKMAASFSEMHRILCDDGILTVMFTHKKVEAWDTLASALIGAGFVIQASWPVHTEFEHSLHQAKKNAAASTIFLVCRKRIISQESSHPVWWDDLQAEVRQVARQKAGEYSAQGISGADLYISVFGPTLSVISQHWPVLSSQVDAKTGQPRPLRPETALDLAREEVVKLRKEGLLGGRQVQFDAITDWYLLVWDAYAAEQFPYDEGRKMAVALGVDLDHDVMSIERLAVKKGEFISLQKPADRRKNGMVDDEITDFPHWIDAAHTAMMVYTEDGAPACDLFLMKSGLKRDGTFKALLQTMINSIPRNKEKGKFVRPEAETLDALRLAFFEDLTVPAEEVIPLPQGKQPELFSAEVQEIEEEDEE